YAKERMVFGSTNRNRLSRFAEEIPEDKIELSDETINDAKFSPYAPAQKAPAPAAPRMVSGVGTTPHATGVTINFAVGDRVQHKVFGEGTVLSILPMGNDHLIETAFDKIGTKKVMANFAKLQKK
ncbi:MAG: ATP-dependent DNA helicase PcrA, partial [Oscillospiraceae bacterium]